MAFTGLNYNAPTQTASGTASSIDSNNSASQMETYFYLKKAIIYARKQMFFSPLASVVNMPKNFGKTIKVFAYVPLLDDRNVNSQGLNAAGTTIANGNLYGSSRDVGTINAVDVSTGLDLPVWFAKARCLSSAFSPNSRTNHLSSIRTLN